MAERVVLMTVGTTRFEELTWAALGDGALVTALEAAGYTGLVVQHGRGAVPSASRSLPLESWNFPEDAADRVGIPSSSIYFEREGGGEAFQVRHVDFVRGLPELMKRCALVISHAGAGSMFEALKAGVPCIAVPNARLMNNHQVELARRLHDLGHLFMAQSAEHVAAMVHRVTNASDGDLVPYRAGIGAKVVAERIDTLFRKQRAGPSSWVARLLDRWV